MTIFSKLHVLATVQSKVLLQVRRIPLAEFSTACKPDLDQATNTRHIFSGTSEIHAAAERMNS